MKEQYHIVSVCFLLFTLGAYAPCCAAEKKEKTTQKTIDSAKKGALFVKKTLADANVFAAKVPVAKTEATAHWRQAKEKYQAVLDAGATGTEREAAQYGLARSAYEIGEYWSAFTHVEASFPRVFDAQELANRLWLEHRIAEELLAQGDAPVPGAEAEKKKLTGWAAASRVFKAIVYNDPRSPRAPQALLLQGDCHLKAGEYEAADAAYRSLIKHMGKTPQAVCAHAGLAEALAKTPRTTQGLSREIALEIEQLLLECEGSRGEDPEVERRVRAAITAQKDAQAAGLLEKARFHVKRRTKRDRKAAIFLLEDIGRQYEGTTSATKAKTLLQSLGVKTGETQK